MSLERPFGLKRPEAIPASIVRRCRGPPDRLPPSPSGGDAPVAQWIERASDEVRGRWFESSRGRWLRSLLPFGYFVRGAADTERGIGLAAGLRGRSFFGRRPASAGRLLSAWLQIVCRPLVNERRMLSPSGTVAIL